MVCVRVENIGQVNVFKHFLIWEIHFYYVL